MDGVEERHRHRYEVNPKLVEELEAAGLSFVGRDETGERMEITELKGMCGGRGRHSFCCGMDFASLHSAPRFSVLSCPA